MNTLFPDRALPRFQLSSFLPADEAATFLAWLDATISWETHTMSMYGRARSVPCRRSSCDCDGGTHLEPADGPGRGATAYTWVEVADG